MVIMGNSFRSLGENSSQAKFNKDEYPSLVERAGAKHIMNDWPSRQDKKYSPRMEEQLNASDNWDDHTKGNQNFDYTASKSIASEDTIPTGNGRQDHKYRISP